MMNDTEFVRHMIGVLCTSALGLIALSCVLYAQWFVIFWAFFRLPQASTRILGTFLWDRSEARTTLIIEALALLTFGAIWGMS